MRCGGNSLLKAAHVALVYCYLSCRYRVFRCLAVAGKIRRRQIAGRCTFYRVRQKDIPAICFNGIAFHADFFAGAPAVNGAGSDFFHTAEEAQ